MQPVVQVLPLWIKIVLAVIPALVAVFAGIGLLLNVQQSRRTNAQARAALVAGCLKGFADDEDIQRAFYSIEYSNFTYGADFHGSVQECEIDKLLRHFANLALSWQTGLISTADVRPVHYYLKRILRYPEICKYLKFMEDWSTSQNVTEHPYVVLTTMGRALEK